MRANKLIDSLSTWCDISAELCSQRPRGLVGHDCQRL